MLYQIIITLVSFVFISPLLVHGEFGAEVCKNEESISFAACADLIENCKSLFSIDMVWAGRPCWYKNYQKQLKRGGGGCRCKFDCNFPCQSKCQKFPKECYWDKPKGICRPIGGVVVETANQCRRSTPSPTKPSLPEYEINATQPSEYEITNGPTTPPTLLPTQQTTISPTSVTPSFGPTVEPTSEPTTGPTTNLPSVGPTMSPVTSQPTASPTS